MNIDDECDLNTLTIDPDTGETVIDLDPMGGLVAGTDAVAQAVARIVEPMLAAALNSGFDQTGDDLTRLQESVQAAAEEDERVFTATVTLAYDDTARTLDVEVDGQTLDGTPFSFSGKLGPDLILRILEGA